MSSIFDFLRGEMQERYGTGMWPLYYPRPWNLNPPPGIGAIIDPVAVAAETSKELQKIGWPGIGLMDRDFQMSLLDAPEAELTAKVEKWFEGRRCEVADLIEGRLSTYDVNRFSKTAEEAMKQAIEAYRNEKYLTVLRVLLPEFEGIGRMLATDRVSKTSQAKVIEKLKDLINNAPIINDDPLETMSLYPFIQERIFASCHTEADAEKFDGVPNRHAELHGLASYGTLKGASIVLCSTDLLLKLSARLLDLGHVPPAA